MGFFFVLVTQADGSARRLPILTYACALALFVVWSQMQGGSDFADRARADAVDYLHENPYVEVPERYELVIPAAYADALRSEFYAEREAEGLPPISDFLLERSQGEFVDLLAYALSKVKTLPVWKYGIQGTNADPIDWLAHVGVHETAAALWVSIILLLCLGIALEDGWGTLAFAGLAAAGVGATAFASVALGYTDAVHMPWFGASGLIATLLGAHFVRSLGGSPRLFGAIPLPGWLVLPAWLALDTMLVRGVTTLEAFDPTPLTVQAAGFALGAVVSIALLLAKFETHQIDKEQDREELVSNPVLERALKAKEAGRLEQAYDMLRTEHRRAGDNRDVALALWDAALPVGKAARVVDAMLSVVESDLQSGNGSQAVANWFSLTDEVDGVQAAPAMLVRMGEALLDEGHPESAVSTLGMALQQKKPVPTALAQRIVRVARDLDPELTRKAAQVALGDAGLAPGERQELERLSEEVTPTSAASAAATPAAAPPEPQTASAPPPVAASDAADEYADLDPQAISLDEGGSDTPLEAGLEGGETQQPEAWNDPTMITDLDRDLSNDVAEDLGSDLGDGLDHLLDGEMDDAFDDLDDEALAQAAFDAGAIEADELSLDATGDTVTQVEAPSAIPRAEETVTEVVVPVRDNDETTTVVNAVPALREAQVRDAVPLTLEPEAIVIEIAGGSGGGKKTRLPYTRIEAISAAAVSGLGPKPIVVIDFALNWQAASETLKLVRFRSDRFDPGALVPDMSNQLAALQKLLDDLVERSGATPLPNFNAATGKPFAVHEGLEVYSREVLGVRIDA